MAGTALEILCSVILLVGFGGVMFTLIDNKWEIQDLESLRIQANAEVCSLGHVNVVYLCRPVNIYLPLLYKTEVFSANV